MPQILTFVLEEISDTALIVRPVHVDADHTITLGTFFKCDATGGAIALTLPPATNDDSRIIIVKKSDNSVNAVTVTAAGSDTIDGAATFVLSNQYEFVVLINDEDGDIWNVIGSG